MKTFNIDIDEECISTQSVEMKTHDEYLYDHWSIVAKFGIASWQQQPSRAYWMYQIPHLRPHSGLNLTAND